LTTPSIAFSGIQEIEVTEDSNRTCIAPPPGRPGPCRLHESTVRGHAAAPGAAG
jgi:hypothetical protein